MKTTRQKPKAPQVPEKWKWHYERLASLRDALIENRMDQVAEASEPLDSRSLDAADNANDEFDHNFTMGILSHEESSIHELDEAMQRILNGTYGICETTGKPIPDVRLRVVPWTRYTREALELLERNHPEKRRFLAEVASIQDSGTDGLEFAPEPEDLMTMEVAIRKRREKIRDFAGEENLTLTSNPPFES